MTVSLCVVDRSLCMWQLQEEFQNDESPEAVFAISLAWFKEWETFVRAKTDGQFSTRGVTTHWGVDISNILIILRLRRRDYMPDFVVRTQKNKMQVGKNTS